MPRKRSKVSTVRSVRAYHPKTIPFDGAWRDTIGTPQLSGSWIIWGKSANGKTRFALMLARYLSTFVKVAYDSLEEGLCASTQEAIAAIGFSDQKRKFYFLDKMDIFELREWLRQPRSPRVVFIDSLQYSGLRQDTYKNLLQEFPKKLFIWVSHASGVEPKGSVAQFVRYDAFVKIHVEGFRAFAVSRFADATGAPFDIWPIRSAEYWNNVAASH